MKLTIHQDLHFPETEIIVNCAAVDSRLERLIRLIRQHSFRSPAMQTAANTSWRQKRSSILKAWTAKPFFIWRKTCIPQKKP